MKSVVRGSEASRVPAEAFMAIATPTYITAQFRPSARKSPTTQLVKKEPNLDEVRKRDRCEAAGCLMLEGVTLGGRSEPVCRRRPRVRPDSPERPYLLRYGVVGAEHPRCRTSLILTLGAGRTSNIVAKFRLPKNRFWLFCSGNIAISPIKSEICTGSANVQPMSIKLDRPPSRQVALFFRGAAADIRGTTRNPLAMLSQYRQSSEKKYSRFQSSVTGHCSPNNR